MDHVREVLGASQNGDLEAVRQYIAANAISVMDEEGSTPLMYSAANDRENVVRALLGSGVEVDQQNLYGWTALLQASCYGHHEVVYTLLQHNADIDLCNSWVTTPLVAAAQGGFTTVVQVLLEKGAEVACGDEVLSPTPLMVAAQCGHEAIVSQLLSHGSNVNTRLQATGWTPLMLSALNNHLVVAQVLLRHGAVREMRDVNNKRAIDIASSLGHKSIVNLLSEDLSVTSSVVDIFEAAKQGDVNMLHEALTKHKASANVIDKEGATPLIYAARKGNVSICQVLLEAGADVDAQDHTYGWTAFMHSTHHKHHEVARLLSQHGANVTLRAKNGSSAFDIANLLGDSHMIQLIATVTIQRLSQQKNSGYEAKRGTVMSPLVEEEEHTNTEAKMSSSVPQDAEQETDISPGPVSAEMILRRLSNAYQIPEPPSKFLKEHQERRGLLSPRMLSPLPCNHTPSPSPEPGDVFLPAVTKPFSPPEPSSPSPCLTPTTQSSSVHATISKDRVISPPTTQGPVPLQHKDTKLFPSSSKAVKSRKPIPELKKTPKRPPELHIPQHSDHGSSMGHLNRLSPQVKSPKSPRSLQEDPFRSLLRQHSQQKLMFRGPLLRKDEMNVLGKSRVTNKSRIMLPSHGTGCLTKPFSRKVIDDGNKRSKLPQRTGVSETLIKRSSFEKLKLRTSRKGPGLEVVLAEAALGQYYHLFEQQEMDLDLFLTLSEDDLTEVGVSDLADQNRLLSLIAQLKRSTPLKSPTRTKM